MESKDTEIIFVLGDTLPTYYDVAISLFAVATKPGSAKMKQAIQTFCNKLIEIWTKSFPSTLDRNYVLGRKAVVNRIEKLVLIYYNKVYNVVHRTSVKNPGEVRETVSIRRLNKQWKATSIDFRVQGVIHVYKIDNLFDIDINTEFLAGADKIFYNDQKTARICRLSEEIDQQWVQEQLVLLQECKEQEQL